MLGQRERTTFDFNIGGSAQDSYTGEWLKGTETRQGLGTLVKADGTRYYGFFVNDRFHGKGKLTFATNDE